MRYLLVFVGAAVVAYLITKGVSAVLADRQPKSQGRQPKSLDRQQKSSNHQPKRRKSIK